MKNKWLLFSLLAMCGIGISHAQDAVQISVGDGASVTQSAQFQLTTKKTITFVDGKAVVTAGDTSIAELPISNGAQMKLSFGTYDESTNKLSATVGSAGYGTLYSAFQLVVPESEVKVYAPTYADNKVKINESTLLTAGTVIPCGTGLLLKNAGTFDFNFSEATPSEMTSALTGSVIAVPVSSITDGTIYALGKKNEKVAFYKYSGDKTVAGKAYLLIGSSEAKAIEFEEDNATDICNANFSPLPCGESGREGAYNLQGMRVNENYKGIVIQNGKKFLNK